MAKLAKLPPPILTALQEQIRENHYGQYHALSDWLKQQGYTVGKSTIHRYAQHLKEKDGYTAKGNSNELLAQITTEDFDSLSLSSLYKKLGKLEHEKQKMLNQINQLLNEEKA